jgi:hypothetical protein
MNAYTIEFECFDPLLIAHYKKNNKPIMWTETVYCNSLEYAEDVAGDRCPDGCGAIVYS